MSVDDCDLLGPDQLGQFDKSTVIGMKLLVLAEWVRRSDRVLEEGENPGKMPVLAMPPMQRSAVWRPKQVLDLWDSLMRGLPIGTFYLLDYRKACPGNARNVVSFDSNKTTPSEFPGFDLLDGQQRLRALCLGVLGLGKDERCLWVDLGAKAASGLPRLYLTSAAQPFGYDPDTGSKYGVSKRRSARKNVELSTQDATVEQMIRDRKAILVKEEGELRIAYDRELFGGPIAPEGVQIGQPPLPFGATAGKTFKLHKLLAAWRKRSPLNDEKGIEALREKTKCDISESHSIIDAAVLKALHQAFLKVEDAQVALLCVDPTKFDDKGEDLLMLFGRIGAGGAPLTHDEQLFSIYKHHYPQIRDAVNDIFDNVGRVLPPIKIAVTALRIANAGLHEQPDQGNGAPSVQDFAKEMAERSSDLRDGLLKLIPMTGASGDGAEQGLFFSSFARVRELLSHAPKAGSFWAPDVMLAQLPAELWQVLIFWATRRPDSDSWEQSRREAVRFALFWRLSVENDEKAANRSFRYLKQRQSKTLENFPGADLYRLLTGEAGGESCATALISPDQFRNQRRQDQDESIWRSDGERFGEHAHRNVIASNWWRSKKMLPWLQRDYIRAKFPGYAPLSDHEDDLPYDVDHICPKSDWRLDWRKENSDRFDKIDEPAFKAMRDNRDALGDGVGNLRLIASWENRHDQDAPVAGKMRFVGNDAEPTQDELNAMKDSAFPLEDRGLWLRASGTDRKWTMYRLAAFQQAVERRAVWLYKRFYDDLGYECWTSRRENDAPPE